MCNSFLAGRFISRKRLQMTLVNRPALGSFPATNFPQLLRDSLLRAAPGTFQEVLTMACGSCSNENAFKTAFFSYMKRRRGEELPPAGSSEYITCMHNQVCKNDCKEFVDGAI